MHLITNFGDTGMHNQIICSYCKSKDIMRMVSTNIKIMLSRGTYARGVVNLLQREVKVHSRV